MHRQLVTRTQYLAELNRRLREHPAYTAPPIPFAEIAGEAHTQYRVVDL